MSSTSSSSTNLVNPASGSGNILRLTGMASGLDVDATVKAMMTPYQTNLDKLGQDMQTLHWTQDSYRDTLSSVNSFKSSFLDVINPSTYMLSQNAYASFTPTVYDAGTTNASTSVSVKGGAGAVAGSYKVDFTGGNLAVAAGLKSGASVQTAAGTGALWATKLSDLFGSGTVDTSKVTINYNNGSGAQSATVNVTAGMTISDFAQAISSATSNTVTAQYSELTGKLSIQTSNTGAATSLSITDTGVPAGTLLDKLNIGAAGVATAGQDLKVKITPPGEAVGTTVTRSSNQFTVDGITYNCTAAKSADITLAANVDNTYNNIKSFIDKYNDMIDKINTKVTEQKPKGYPPLTDAQKASMSESQITAWETKAKTGLLENDSMLQSMLTSMRSAFYQTVQGAGVTLTQIGLSTSSDVSQGGKIIIDETKLKAALQNSGQQVADLFSKVSTSQPAYSPDLTSAQRTTRSNEEGIFQRISDVLQDYTRTTRDTKGKKGLLIEKAGIAGDYTEFNNLLFNQEKDKQKQIDDMKTKFNDKQTYYYNKFSQLESAMNALNAQQASLASMLGTGTGG